ncbi:MAG: hypothetical protein M3461_08325 [Pseudomonadota bacterium]|nr:hypothetical protein [Pseudomonadota bacterium]
MIGRASTPADGPEIIELFRHAFGVDGDVAVRNQPFVQWKYWGPHLLLEGSRGRVIEGDGTFAAHGCI